MKWTITVESSQEPVRARMRLESVIRYIQTVFSFRVIDVESVQPQDTTAQGDANDS